MLKAFNCISWFLAAYFMFAFHYNSGVPPTAILDDGLFIYVVLAIFFFLLPFAKTLKIGSVFEYAAKVEEIKKDVQDFKEETRQLIGLQNTLINNVSQTVSHNVHVTIPSLSAAHQAEEQLRNTLHAGQYPDAEDHVTPFVEGAGGDYNLALMQLRRDLEIELRRILNKESSFSAQKTKSGFIGLGRLWSTFLRQHPDRRGMESALLYVLDICNAASHGQAVPEGHALEALSMGIKILGSLKEIEPLRTDA